MTPEKCGAHKRDAKDGGYHVCVRYKHGTKMHQCLCGHIWMEDDS